MIQLPKAIQVALHNQGHTITQAKPITGGNINLAYQFTTSDKGLYLLKYNADPQSRVLASEVKGLELLRSTGNRVPQIVFYDLDSELDFILMEWIESGHPNDSALSEALVDLHHNTREEYGLDHDNHIGSLPQTNSQGKDFTEYYINNRLEPQLKLSIDQGYALKVNFEKFQGVLKNEIPIETPVLVHGDLWSGNLIHGKKGPVFIDPSVSYGHREMDLGMMQLFGGFGDRIFMLYEDSYQLIGDWRKRSDLFQLYYLLVHLNLFGVQYRGGVESIFKKYSD